MCKFMKYRESVKARLIETEEGFYVIAGTIRKESGMSSSYFLVDTGASNSIFIADVATHILGKSLLVGLGRTIHSYTGMVSLSISNVRVMMEAHLVERSMLPSIKGYAISGILGSDFFLSNKVVLDFSTSELYQQTSQGSDTIYGCFPMSLGMESYKVPMLMLENAGGCFFFIVDSGSDINIISANSLERIQDVTKEGSESFCIQSLAACSQSVEYIIPFQIHSLTGRQQIMERFACPVTGGKDVKCQDALFDINGVVGNAFLRKHKMVLDYHQKLFYSMTGFGC